MTPGLPLCSLLVREVMKDGSILQIWVALNPCRDSTSGLSTLDPEETTTNVDAIERSATIAAFKTSNDNIAGSGSA